MRVIKFRISSIISGGVLGPDYSVLTSKHDVCRLRSRLAAGCLCSSVALTNTVYVIFLDPISPGSVGNQSRCMYSEVLAQRSP